MPRRKFPAQRRGRAKPEMQRCLASVKDPRIREIVEDMLFATDRGIRESAASVLGKIGSRKAVPALKAALFDSRRIVREAASKSLSEIIGLRKVTEFINRQYPGKALSRVPAHYLPTGRISAAELLKLRQHGYPTMRQLLDMRRKGYPLTSWAEMLREKYGKPAFYHRGLPVFLVAGVRELILSIGKYHYGAFLVEKNKERLPSKFRRAVAEHEFGEIFGHDIGNALQMLWLERYGLFQKYINRFPSIGEEFLETIRKDPKGFAEFKKYFPELQNK